MLYTVTLSYLIPFTPSSNITRLNLTPRESTKFVKYSSKHTSRSYISLGENDIATLNGSTGAVHTRDICMYKHARGRFLREHHKPQFIELRDDIWH